MKGVNYIKDVKAEMRHVSWPTGKQTVYFTIIVVAISVLTAYFLGLFDFIFGKILAFFI